MKALLFKGLSVALVGSCLLASRATALMVPDADGDGMSDVWEGQHGFSITSGSAPTHQGPAADPDQDGWTNLEESEAGTDPNSAAAPAGMVQPTILRHPDFESLMIVSWPSLAGKQYTLLACPDLTSGTWSAVDVPMMGTGQLIDVGMETLHPDGSRPEKLFWRVAVSDVDTDGDNVSDWNELQLGLNPNLADSDGDTLADGVEIQAGLNPGHRDTDLDGIPDNLDSAPLQNAALADRDGANLSQSLNAGLLGRWDFEGSGPSGTLLVSTPETVPPSNGAIDISGNGAFWDGLDVWPKAASGMPWKCLHLTGPAAHAQLPMDLVGSGGSSFRFNHDVQTWAMWIKFERPSGGSPTTPGVLDASSGRRTLFSIGRDETLSSNDPASRPLVQCYFDGNGTPTNSLDNKLVFSTWSGGVETVRAFWATPAALDDGEWHHIAVYFDDNNGGFGRYQAWLDGSAYDANKPDVLAGGAFTYTLNSAPHPWCYLGRFMKNFAPAGHEVLGALVDRLRVYNKPLTATDTAGLYNQDIDRDGLFDRTEARSRFWRDLDQDRIDQQAETTFPVDPFHWDADDADHDRDGLSTHAEQNLHFTDPWKPDSDGDLIPDGWEIQYGLNPNNNSDAYSDSEPLASGGPDGLTNLAEYSWGTNPKARDTDLDGTPDGQEVGPPGSSPPSHPNDPRDGGQPIPIDQKLTIKIAVGDESGSHSEDYVVECRRIDPETGAEVHVYTVRSGGFGQFSNPAPGYSMFRKGDTHTFQLKWQGTKNTVSGSGSPSDGPDYDYTFRVEPQGEHGGILIDSWHKQNGSVDVGKPLQGTGLNNVATNEAGFRTKIEDRRVALVKLKVEWEEIAGFENLSDHVDPWTGETKGKRIFPCYKNPTDTVLRAKVKVVVHGGLSGMRVFVRSYDIDDGTYEQFDTRYGEFDPVIDVNGRAGDDNLVDYFDTEPDGQFWEEVLGIWSGSTQVRRFNAAGRAEFDFRVGMQPGSNYRVVASPLDESEFVAVQTDNETTADYLGPELAQHAGKIASVPLTVWRHLWIENDSMEAIPNDDFGYKRNDLGADIENPIVNEEVSLDPDGNSIFSISTISDGSSFFGLENGSFVVQGFPHKVIGTGVTGDEDNFVIVPGNYTDIPVNSEFRLYDDDDFGLAAPPLPRTNLVGDTLKNSFKSSFIEVVDAADYHDENNMIPFYRSYWQPYTPGILDDKVVLSGSREKWVVNLVAAYQGPRLEDGDPGLEEETSGFTWPGELSVVYVEAVREQNDPVMRNPNAEEKDLEGLRAATEELIQLVAAHEIGHMPTSDFLNFAFIHHAEGGLMAKGGVSIGDEFSARSVARFRRVENWQD